MAKQEIVPAEERWPELCVIAEQIADDACRQINTRGPFAISECPYPRQGILEMTIAILQKRV